MYYYNVIMIINCLIPWSQYTSLWSHSLFFIRKWSQILKNRQIWTDFVMCGECASLFEFLDAKIIIIKKQLKNTQKCGNYCCPNFVPISFIPVSNLFSIPYESKNTIQKQRISYKIEENPQTSLCRQWENLQNQNPDSILEHKCEGNILFNMEHQIMVSEVFLIVVEIYSIVDILVIFVKECVRY